MNEKHPEKDILNNDKEDGFHQIKMKKTLDGYYIEKNLLQNYEENSQQAGSIVVIGEDFKTMPSVYDYSGYQAFVAFTHNNLLPVPKAVRAKYRMAKVIICADNDWKDIKTGQRKDIPEKGYANLPALKCCGCVVALCPEIEAGSNFNDLHQKYERNS